MVVCAVRRGTRRRNVALRLVRVAFVVIIVVPVAELLTPVCLRLVGIVDSVRPVVVRPDAAVEDKYLCDLPFAGERAAGVVLADQASRIVRHASTAGRDAPRKKIVVVGAAVLHVRAGVVEADFISPSLCEHRGLRLAFAIVLVQPRLRRRRFAWTRFRHGFEDEPVLLRMAAARIAEGEAHGNAARGNATVVRVGRVAPVLDLVLVRHAVVVGVVGTGVRPPFALLTVRQPVVVSVVAVVVRRIVVCRVIHIRIEAVCMLPAVVHAVAVGVRLERICADLSLFLICQPIAVGVLL